MSQRTSSRSSKLKRRGVKDSVVGFDEGDNLTNVYLDGLMKEKIKKLENQYQQHLVDLQTKWNSDRVELLDEISSIRQNVTANIVDRVDKSEEIPEIFIEAENNSIEETPIKNETKLVAAQNSPMDQLLMERLDSVETVLRTIASGINPTGINPNRGSISTRGINSRGRSSSPTRISSASPMPPTQMKKSNNRLTETNSPKLNSPLNKRQLTQSIYMASSPKSVSATDSYKPEFAPNEPLGSDSLEAAFNKFNQTTDSIAVWQQSYAKQLDEFQDGVALVKQQLEYALNEMLRYKEQSDNQINIISDYYESSKQTRDAYEQDISALRKSVNSIIMEKLPTLDSNYKNLQVALLSNKEELGQVLKEVREIKIIKLDLKTSNNNNNNSEDSDALHSRISALENDNKSMRQAIQQLSKQMEKLVDNKSVVDTKINNVKTMYDNFNVSSEKKFDIILDQLGQVFKTVEHNSDTSILRLSEVDQQLSSHKKIIDGSKHSLEAFKSQVDNNFSEISTQYDSLHNKLEELSVAMISDDDYAHIDKIDVKTGAGSAKLMSIIGSLKADISDEESNVENLKQEKSNAKNSVKEWIRVFTEENGRAPLLAEKETQRELYEQLNATSSALTEAAEYLDELKQILGKAETKLYGSSVTHLPEVENVPVEEPVDRDTVVKLQSMWRMHKARAEFQNKKVMVNRIAVYMKIWLRRVRKRIAEEQKRLNDDLRSLNFEQSEAKSKKDKRVHRRSIQQSKQVVSVAQLKTSSGKNTIEDDEAKEKEVNELVASITSIQLQLDELSKQKNDAKQQIKYWQDDFKKQTGRDADKSDKKSIRGTFAMHQSASIQKDLKVRELDRLVDRLKELCGDEFGDLHKIRADSFDTVSDGFME